MTTVFKHDPQVNVYNTASWINGFEDICHKIAQDARSNGDIDRSYDMFHAQKELARLRNERYRWR